MIDLYLLLFGVVDDTLDSKLQGDSSCQDCSITSISKVVCSKRRDVSHKRLKSSGEIGDSCQPFYWKCGLVTKIGEFWGAMEDTLVSAVYVEALVVSFFDSKKSYGDKVPGLLSCFCLMNQVCYLLNCSYLRAELILTVRNYLVLFHEVFQFCYTEEKADRS